jgi:hypothetical protein
MTVRISSVQEKGKEGERACGRRGQRGGKAGRTGDLECCLEGNSRAGRRGGSAGGGSHCSGGARSEKVAMSQKWGGRREGEEEERLTGSPESRRELRRQIGRVASKKEGRRGEKEKLERGAASGQREERRPQGLRLLLPLPHTTLL